MRQINLKTAAIEIRQAVQQRALFNPPQTSPFFFIVGAGVSHPPIPLAGTIENDCRIEAGKYKTSPLPLTDKPLGTYSYWFEQAYPSAEARQHYLRSLMENASISSANFRLAHLLLNKTVGKIVVTPNFDDFLSRALVLFGHRPVVCDHPRTLERISVESQDVQIVHVHGSYWFYDCCNLSGEIEDRAQKRADLSFTTRSSLEEILRFRSPLVIGYSGWVGDVIMNALETRLSSRLGNNLYWFCHKRSDIDSLPDWLKEAPEVRFVVPEEQEPPDLRRPHSVPPVSSPDVEEPVGEFANEKGESRVDSRIPILTATDVFDALIEEFKIPVPDLTKDPLGFFANQLRESLLVGSAANLDKDIYQIRNVIERLEKARDAERSTLQSPTDLLLEDLRNAVRKSDYRGSVDIASTIDLTKLDAEALRDLMSILTNTASALDAKGATLDDNKAIELKAYDLIAAAGHQLNSDGVITSKDKIRWVNALIAKAITFGQVDLNTDELRTYDLIVSTFDQESDLTIQEQIARALLYKGMSLGLLKQQAEAIVAYQAAINRLKNSTTDEALDILTSCLLYKASCLALSGLADQALEVFSDLIERFQFSSLPEVQENVATGMNRKGNLLKREKKIMEAIEAYSIVQERFGHSLVPDILSVVCTAMVNRAMALGELENYDECLAVHEEVFSRFGVYTNLSIQTQVARSLGSKATILALLQQLDQSISTYDLLIERLKNATEPLIRRYVIQAFTGKIANLVAQDKNDEALGACNQALDQFEDSTDPSLMFQISKLMLFKASLSKTNSEKIKIYDRLIKRFGESERVNLKHQVERAKSLKIALEDPQSQS